MALCRFWGAAAVLACAAASAQVIQFESGGLMYQTLTKGGLTIMFAPLPTHIKDYSILQVAVSNGSQVSWTIKPEDFVFVREDGSAMSGAPVKEVVVRLMQSGGRNDVIKLVQTYEMSIYGLSRYKSTNGYEQRRQAAFGAVTSTKLKSAAAASAVALGPTKLAPGKSSDGAVFFEHSGKGMGAGRIVVKAAGEVFQFDPMEPKPGAHNSVQ
jgi:hypothetical protein